MTTAADPRRQLVEDIAGMVHDPLAFVLYAFPWGRQGTTLAAESGPRQWQRDVLVEIGNAVREGRGMSPALQAISSGHGIGKSALVSWLILWSLSTRENTRGVVTANTATQLASKTWPEVKKWHGLAINRAWFTCAATSVHSASPALEKTWRIDAIPWSEHNTEAFAGLHNKGNRVVLLFDEASAIADKVWEVAEGALTDENTEILWTAFGNPTRNTGRFHDAFGKLGHRWKHRQIDSRTVDGTNKAQIQRWIEDYGEDSDFVRVRVRGMFPRASSTQFIGSDLVDAARRAEPIWHAHDPLVLGVDVARFGDDESVIQPRAGRDARTLPRKSFRGLDTMQFAARVAEEVDALRRRGLQVAMIYVDETGVGAGVVDRLRDLGLPVRGVNNGARSDAEGVDGEACANKGAECWAKMRTWLKTGGALDSDDDLAAQLQGREYGFDAHNRIVLERKDDMKKRGLSSPDRADALALTFAYPVFSGAVGRPGAAITDPGDSRLAGMAVID